MRVLASIAALLFAYSAALQLNDPDPVRWFLLYGFAALVCVLHVLTRVPCFVPYTLTGVAVVWAATLLPSVLASASLTGTEEEREFAGLALVAAVCAVLGRRSSREAAEDFHTSPS